MWSWNLCSSLTLSIPNPALSQKAHQGAAPPPWDAHNHVHRAFKTWSLHLSHDFSPAFFSWDSPGSRFVLFIKPGLINSVLFGLLCWLRGLISGCGNLSQKASWRLFQITVPGYSPPLWKSQGRSLKQLNGIASTVESRQRAMNEQMLTCLPSAGLLLSYTAQNRLRR